MALVGMAMFGTIVVRAAVRAGRDRHVGDLVRRRADAADARRGDDVDHLGPVGLADRPLPLERRSSGRSCSRSGWSCSGGWTSHTTNGEAARNMVVAGHRASGSMMQVFVLSVQNAVAARADRLGDGAGAVLARDRRDDRRDGDGRDREPGPADDAARWSRGGRGAPPAAGVARRARGRAAPAFLAAACVAVVVWVIALVGVKEVPLRSGFDDATELAAVDASGAPTPRRSVPMAEHDFMPLDGWDHVELWVGNAKQAAYFYEHALGFARTAYAGPETGVRDRASYVLEQGDIRLVLTSGAARATARSRASRARTATASRTSRCACPTRARRTARRSSAARAASPSRTRSRTSSGASSSRRSRRTATTSTRSSTAPTTRAPYLPGYVAQQSTNGAAAADVGLTSDRPRRRQRRARPDGSLGRVLRARVRHDRDDPLLRRGDLDRVLGADVEGDDGRRGEDQVPDQRAGRGEAQEPDRGVPRLQPRPRRAAHRDGVERTSSGRSRRCRSAA